MRQGHAPDLWRATGATGAVTFFDMLGGLRQVRNVLGVSDPDVHRINGRWVMYLGGFTTRFKVLLFSAVLPEGASLASDGWALVTDPRRPTSAVPLTPAPSRGQWDSHGMHSPSYVHGRADGRSDERIYYAGRSSRSITGRSSRYSIGYLRRTAAGWTRHGRPVHTGTAARPSVLEPVVRYDGGTWRMWYLSTIGEVGRGELPDYQLEYVESNDGTARWSTPQVLFSTLDGYFDNAVQRVGDHYEMVVARGTNLHGTSGFPAQGLWWLRSLCPSGRRADWSKDPVRLLDTDVAPLAWFANGACSPSFIYGDTAEDRDTMYVFFTGTYARTSWLRTSVHRLARRQRPPVPAPYYLATGRITIPAPGDRSRSSAHGYR